MDRDDLMDRKDPEKINYLAFTVAPGGRRRQIGHADFESNTVTTLAYVSGTPVSSLYQVIEAGYSKFALTDEVYSLSEVQILPPISGRDVLAVGKNYVEHAKEFNESGYDASDKNDQPTHPVIFTKRATSIIAHGEDILPHQSFTSSPDYEGEIGVIIGKTGFQINETNAWDYVWGYTIINDMTARERQRDHKQFYLGKSPDTYCPMGPVAVRREHLPKTLVIQTHVNGEKRQEANSDQLIFSIPFLIKTLSAAQTLRPGDVLATGTPAGVGFGFRPMKFLLPGDEISVSVTGLGELKNKIASFDSINRTAERIVGFGSGISNPRALDVSEPRLTEIGLKHLFYRHLKSDSDPQRSITFIHGLGSSHDYFSPLIPNLRKRNDLHLLDLEGCGLSPTKADSVISIESFAEDVFKLLQMKNVGKTVVIAHSLGALVAMRLATTHPGLVTSLVLMGPPASPLSDVAKQRILERVKLVRRNGIQDIADDVVDSLISTKTKTQKRVVVAALRFSLKAQDPEGYAKACNAFASASEIDISKISCPVLILTGSEDVASSPELCRDHYGAKIASSRVEVVESVGHCHLLEDEEQVSLHISEFLNK